MPKHGKNYRNAEAKVESGKLYTPKQAAELVKELACAKFDETVECSIRLGVDTRKADQNVRGSISLPHGTGKTVRVAVLLRVRRLARLKLLAPISLVLTILLHPFRLATLILMPLLLPLT